MIYTLIFTAVVGYVALCLALGFGSPGTLANHRADDDTIDRHFRETPHVVEATYRRAVERTPGMRLAESERGVMLVDLRPTTRIIAGNFGMAIRLAFTATADGTQVRADSRNKVRIALVNHHAAFVHAERALRQRAKTHGLHELMVGVDVAP